MPDLNINFFKGIKDQPLQVKVETIEDPISLSIYKVEERTSAPKGFSSFVVHLTSPTTVILPQAIYEIQREHEASFSLFMVPVAQDEEGICYEAVFNQRSDEA